MKIFKTIIPVVLALIFACMLSSCEYETIQPQKSSVVITPGTVIKFSEKVYPIFSKYGCTACHPTAKNLDFSSLASAYTSVKSEVVVSAPASSPFYIKMSSTHNGKDITVDERAYILEWIKEGALNN